ncbi:MAG: hypothetical protein IJT43_06335 [Stomatobaculum sp.]|nr:hypothetical protein [Stomatobaculum sp.]
MREHSRPLAVFSSAHFLVDLCCIFLETAYILSLVKDRTAWLWCVLVYNFFAFACQLPAGIFGDRQKKPWLLAGTGCILVAASYLITAVCLKTGVVFFPGSAPEPAPPSAFAAAPLAQLLLVSAVAGIGNSCFHVGGGIDLLKRSKGSAAMPGVFVSTGAFGVWLGPVLAAKQQARTFGLLFGCILMLFTGLVLIQMHLTRQAWEPGGEEEQKTSEHFNIHIADPSFAAALCLVTAVLFRSYAGTIMRYGWKKAGVAFLFTAGVVFGKMLGGIVGDRAGWRRTAVVSLAVSGLLFLFAEKNAACGIAAVFFFNMTMPLTLTALAKLYRGREGMAFGLTTLALFLGTLPSMAESAGFLFSGSSHLLAPVCIVSLALMAAGLKGEKQEAEA